MQPRLIPCAALNTDHGVAPTRWGAQLIRTATATLGARIGVAAASASFAAATTSAIATADIVPGSMLALDTIRSASLFFFCLIECLHSVGFSLNKIILLFEKIYFGTVNSYIYIYI